MDRKKLFKYSAFLIFFVFVVNFLANKFHWYYTIWYFDMIMHTLGGVWLGLIYLYFFRDNFKLGNALLFVFLLGFGWEVFEFVFNNYIGQNPFDLIDSMSDIFFDLFGGVCGILYLWRR